MDLEQLKKRIYKKEAGIEGRPEAPSTFEPGREPLPLQGEVPQWERSDSVKFLWLNRARKIFWILGAAAVLVFIGLIIWFLVGRSSFDKTKIALDIYGQQRIVSGEEITYVVRYKNNANLSLRSAILEFVYSDQATPTDENTTQQGGSTVSTVNLGDIAAGQDGQAEFKTRVLGNKDSEQKFYARLKYRAGNLSSDYVNAIDFTSIIIAVPLVLNFDLPEKIVSGQTLNFTLRYTNTSDTPFSNSEIHVDYPPGFVFDSAYPSPSQADNIWAIDEIGSQEESRIVIKGTLNGNEGENKIFNAKIGVAQKETFLAFASTLASPVISVSPLSVEQIRQESESSFADLGQKLRFKIKYRNTTLVTIGPVVISVKIDSRAIDSASVMPVNGFFNSNDNTIIWNASYLPALNSLAANQEGEVEYSMRVNEKLPVSNFSDKNFTILATAQIDSPNVPISLIGTQLRGTNQVSIKVNSKLILNVNGYYYDNLIPNSGPLPPRVGQSTTYTIYFRLLNISNDLNDVTVQATLPPYVQWLSRTYPITGEDIKYDLATGKLTWHIDKLPSATGILLPVKQIAFQVALVPSVSQVGSMVPIVKDAKASGSDIFTETEVNSSSQNLNSDMPDDQAMGWGKGSVQN